MKPPTRLICSVILITSLASIAAYRAINHKSTKPSLSNVWKLKPGERLTYDLEYESDSYSDLRGLYRAIDQGAEKNSLAVSPHVYRVSVRCSVVLTALEQTDNGIVVSYRFPTARIGAESEIGALLDGDRVQLELSRDTFCEIDEQGRIRSLMADPTNSGATTNLVRTLLGLMQFSRPFDSELAHWSIDEDDSSGFYKARYELLPMNNGVERTQAGNAVHRFRKTKLEYFEAASEDDRDQPELPKTILPEGAFEVAFDFDRGRIASITGSEKQTIEIAGSIVGGTQNSFRLHLLNESKEPQSTVLSVIEDRANRRASMQPVSLSTGPSARMQLSAVYKMQLGDDSVDTLMADLAALDEGSSKLSYSHLYSNVKALVYLYPACCKRLATVWLHDSANSPTFQLVTGALAAIGSDEAQDALLLAIRMHPDDAIAVQTLLVALGGVKRPTRSSQNAIEEMAWRSDVTPITAAARLELGAIAHNLRERSPERAAEIVEHSIQRLTNRPGAELELIALLGNAGAIESIPVLVRFLNDQSAEVRANAAFALRFIDDEIADESLARVIASDPDASVRGQAVTAFEFRNITQLSLDALSSALRADTSPSVRLKAMNSMWKQHETYPEVRGLLATVATKDSSRDVRVAAARLLATNDAR